MLKYLSLVLLFININVVFSQDKRLEKIDSVVSSWYTNNEFNGNILIAEKGNIIFNKSYGKPRLRWICNPAALCKMQLIQQKKAQKPLF